MNRNHDPRDPAGLAGDDGELIDLHEGPLPSRLDVEPAAVGMPGRRIDPRLGLLVAVAMVTVAVLGAGALAPRGTPTPSLVVPVVTATATPEPTDACSSETAKAPTVSLGVPSTMIGQRKPVIRAVPTGTGDTIDDIDVIVPVGRPLQVNAGRRLEVAVTATRCIELLAIDLIDTARPTSSPLIVRSPAPLDGSPRQLAWDGPPAGDWVVRVSLRLRNLGAGGPWAIYFFRLNSGFVAWESPAPSGNDTGTAQGPRVTPAVPCGPLPTEGTMPPTVNLVLGSESHPGILGEYQWLGHGFQTSVSEGLAAAGPIELSGVYSLQIAADVCATRWLIMVGLPPTLGEEFVATTGVDQSPDNEHHDPAIAAQNSFSFLEDVYGTFVIQAALEFEGGDRETVYWHVHAASPHVPEAHVIAEPSGEPIDLARGCGARFWVDGPGFEICATRWSELPDGPILSIAEGSGLRVDADGHVIIGWTVMYVEQAALAAPGFDPSCQLVLTSAYNEVGVATIEVPPLPPGAWSVRVELTVRDGTDSSVPYFIRVEVPGNPSAAPSPECGFID